MVKEKSRIALAVEYQGTGYKGFQKQKNTKETVQGHLENALSKVADQDIETVCSGRTDAGVHAYNQIIHFDTSSLRDMKSWIKGGNALLPKDIRVLWQKKCLIVFMPGFLPFQELTDILLGILYCLLLWREIELYGFKRT